ncbi:MAG: dihydroorotate dehydrogenase electron transfer subunit [Candidatus Zixiibacteriota bacterium]
MSKITVEQATIERKKELGNSYFAFEISPFSKVKAIKPGQFVHIKIPHTDIYFRRAFSVYDVHPQKKAVEIIFKVFGRGTALLSRLHPGDHLDILGPLGNSFAFPTKKETALLVAGGIGMPPIYFLAKELAPIMTNKSKAVFFYGGNSRTDLVELARIKRLGIRVVTATEDGSLGFRGLITKALAKEIDGLSGDCRIYACGPEGMLKAVDRLALEKSIPGQLSLEAPMPCGIGICLGCILPLTAGGYTRVCREGPVYNVGEVRL